MFFELKIFDRDGAFAGFVGTGKSLKHFLRDFKRYNQRFGYDYLFVNDKQLIVLSGLLVFMLVYLLSNCLRRNVSATINYDVLTGFKNREGIFKKHEQLAVQNDHQFCVVMVDVDHFKQVNDNYAHNTGDQVLKDVSRTLAATIRLQDSIGRWGGEEVIILVPGLTISQA